MTDFSRRGFFRAGLNALATLGAVKLTGCGGGGAPAPSQPSTPPPPDGTPPAVMAPTRPLGQTGHSLPLFSLGGQAALETPGQETLAEDIVNRALDLGVTYIDTSHYYGRGLSESTIGRVLAARRLPVFLATKTLERTYDGAMQDLEDSLRRLQIDRIDLWQMHNVRTQEDLDGIFAAAGALEAFEQARRQGMVRFLGITGHYDPAVLTEGIRRFPFDTVLMPINAADVHDRSFIRETLPEAVARSMGVIAMKIPARGAMFQANGVSTMEQALGYTLTHAVSTGIVGCSSVAEVESNVRVANTFTPFSPEEMTTIEGLTSTYHRAAAFYKYEW
jgi:aryl-alcohol dehydrogenase-like predicted oxidoreductase